MPVGTYLERPIGQEREDLHLRLRNEDLPYVVGYGPIEFSTSMALEPWPSIIWDTNLYYRDLSVKAKASRKEIRSKYLEIDGSKSVRLTMITEVLTNKDRRLLYDLVPFGSLFYDNEIAEAQRQAITDEISNRLAAGEDYDDVIGEDYDARIEETLSAADEQLKINRAFRSNSWSHYLWKSECQDLMKISEWKQLIIRWWWYYYREPVNISIGYMTGDEDVIVKKLGQRTVVFVHDQLDPSDVIACIAVAEMRHHNTN